MDFIEEKIDSLPGRICGIIKLYITHPPKRITIGIWDNIILQPEHIIQYGKMLTA